MKQTKVTAYMNNGQWILNCRVCDTPLPAWETGVICPHCYPGMLAKAFQPIKGGLLRPIADIEIVEAARRAARAKGEEYFPHFPPERSDIERLLRMRPALQNMNWLPGESLDDLRRQNAEHGDPIEETSDAL